jgi:CRP-like cAMP-binding protein
METKRIAALHRTVLFGCLTEKELADVAQRVAELHFDKGEILFLSGEPAKGIFVVVSGEIRVFQQDTEGREQVMHVDTAGAVIGEVPVFDDGPYPASAISELEADVLFIEKSDVHHFCVKYPSLALRALRLMAARVRRHAQLVEALSFHEVGQRLAFFLIKEAQHLNTPAQNRIVLQLLLSNHEIASRIGSVRDVVSRAFGRLRHEGLIVMKGRTLTIPDLRALEKYAGKWRNKAPHRDMAGHTGHKYAPKVQAHKEKTGYQK